MSETIAMSNRPRAARREGQTVPDHARRLPDEGQQGRVLYVGKAKNLRNRAGHYFTKAAAEDPRTADLVKLIADIDFLPAESEVDALLLEARLVKDIQPRFNVELKDDKTFPYLQIRIREDFPRVEFTRSPRRRGVKLYGPFTSASSLRQAIQVLQRIFQFRTCSLDIDAEDNRWRWFRPCLLHSIRQCTAPCNFRVSKEDYRKQIRSLRLVMEGKKDRLLAEMEKEMQEASAALLFEKAARLRDDIEALQKLGQRGEVEQGRAAGGLSHRPEEGACTACARCWAWRRRRAPSRAWTSPTWAAQDTVASLVHFIDGLPFKPGYRRYRIKSVQGVDDFASIREVVTRRFRRKLREEEVFPDILLIDGGKGQLNAALEAFPHAGHRAADADLAGQARGRDLSSRRAGAVAAEPALGGAAAVAVRARRGPPLRAALSPHPAAEETGRVISASGKTWRSSRCGSC